MKKKRALRIALTNKHDSLIEEYSKRYDENIFWAEGWAKITSNIKVIPTDSIAVNWIFGIDGIPKERITEIYGPESSGKSTLCYLLIRCAQKVGKVIYVDSESSFEPAWAKRCGVDCTKEKFMLAQPNTGERAFEIIEDALKDDRVCLVILDSIANLIPKAVSEGDVGDQYMGIKARMNTQEITRITPLLKGSNTAFIIVNQVRANFSGYGDPETTGGGFALKHAVHVKIRVKRREKIEIKGKEAGFYSEFFVKKNKVATPFRKVKIPCMFGMGFNSEYELVYFAQQCGIVQKKMTYKVGARQIGKTWKEAYQKIVSTPKLYAAIVEKTKALLDTSVYTEV